MSNCVKINFRFDVFVEQASWLCQNYKGVKYKLGQFLLQPKSQKVKL